VLAPGGHASTLVCVREKARKTSRRCWQGLSCVRTLCLGSLVYQDGAQAQDEACEQSPLGWTGFRDPRRLTA
jgi:hypothetical protein